MCISITSFEHYFEHNFDQTTTNHFEHNFDQSSRKQSIFFWPEGAGAGEGAEAGAGAGAGAEIGGFRGGHCGGGYGCLGALQERGS